MEQVGQPLDAEKTHVRRRAIKPVEGHVGAEIDPFGAGGDRPTTLSILSGMTTLLPAMSVTVRARALETRNRDRKTIRER